MNASGAPAASGGTVIMQAWCPHCRTSSLVASPDLVAKRDLGRYYLALSLAARDELRGHFRRDELCLVMDACNGIQWDAAGWQTLWAEVADAIRLAREGPGESYGATWGVGDEDGLVERLRGLSWAGKLALADAVERFWREPERNTDELLAEFGLAVPAVFACSSEDVDESGGSAREPETKETT